MSKVDQFESVFRSADKLIYTHREIRFSHSLLVTDLPEIEARELLEKIRGFLGVLGDDVRWTRVSGRAVEDVGSLLELVEEEKPDFVVTYRSLFSDAWKWPYSLGAHLGVLNQVANCPILVLPHPKAGRAFDHAMKNTDRVMAMTDHLAGDDRLVRLAVHFTERDGTLVLCHVEDDATYVRFIEAISKIPSIQTDEARELILAQLLKEPTDYIRSVRAALGAAEVSIATEEVVTVGHRLREVRRIIEERQVDLLVMHTRDEDQLAMHGLAYPLAVELRELPILLI